MGNFASPPRQDLHLRLHCVDVFVRDQDRSLRFYLDQLGFHLALDARLQSGERWVAVAPPDGSAILSLVVPKPNSPEYKLIGRSTHAVFVTEDVTAKVQEWAKRGVRFQSVPRLRRIKYVQKTQELPSNASSMLLGEEASIWGGVFARFRDGRRKFLWSCKLRRGHSRARSTAARACREAGIRATFGTGNRDCKAGAGTALPANATATQNAGIRR